MNENMHEEKFCKYCGSLIHFSMDFCDDNCKADYKEINEYKAEQAKDQSQPIASPAMPDESFLSVLEENLAAAKQSIKMKFNAFPKNSVNSVIETYEDLIEIYKAKYLSASPSIAVEEKKSVVESFAELRKLGSAWNNIICVCRGLIKDEPCELNCKEFHDESLPNTYLEQQLAASSKEDADAIEFKDWCDKNVWELENREQRAFTTEQLYKIYKQK